MTAQEMPDDDVESVLAALGRIRGRRGPRPHGGHTGRGGHRGNGHASNDHPHNDHPHGDHPWRDRGHDHNRDPRLPSREWFGGTGGRLGGPARMRLLDALVAADAPLSVSDVAAAVGVDQPRASRLIQQAVELGLVRREADPNDARRTRITLTAEGSGFAQSFRGRRHEAVRTALDGMSETDRAEFIRLFTQFASSWPED